MSELEAALERIDKYIESDSDLPPDPETQIGIMAFAAFYVMKTEFSKVVDAFEIDSEGLYHRLDEAIRKRVKKDHNGNYTLNLKGEV